MQATNKLPFSYVDAGPMPDWSKFRFGTPGGRALPKFFLKERLDLTGMEVSLNMLPPDTGMPFTHRHKENEELYLFLSGSGEFQVDGQLLPIRAGSCIRCAPEVSRAWRVTGSEPLVFAVIQAKANSYGPLATIEDGITGEDAPLWA